MSQTAGKTGLEGTYMGHQLPFLSTTGHGAEGFTGETTNGSLPPADSQHQAAGGSSACCCALMLGPAQRRPLPSGWFLLVAGRTALLCGKVRLPHTESPADYFGRTFPFVSSKPEPSFLGRAVQKPSQKPRQKISPMNHANLW